MAVVSTSPPTRTALPEALVFHPTAEEFADPMAYIASIAPQGRECGIVRIVPPPSFQPPFCFPAHTTFPTRMQHLGRLQRRAGPATVFVDKVLAFHSARGRALPTEVRHGTEELAVPTVAGIRLDLYTLWCIVRKAGGSEAVRAGAAGGWAGVAEGLACSGPTAAFELAAWFDKLLGEYEAAVEATEAEGAASTGAKRELDADDNDNDVPAKRFKALGGGASDGWFSACIARLRTASADDGSGMDEVIGSELAPSQAPAVAQEAEDGLAPPAMSMGSKFAFEVGDTYTLTSFRAADAERRQALFGPERELSIGEIESVFWRVVEEGAVVVEAEYGADLDVREYGSGFPATGEYGESGWNLNVMPKLPGSLLSLLDEDIVGVTIPWFYVGSSMSTFCWHTEDNYLYSINYCHLGAPKVWYGIPSSGAKAFEAAIQNRLKNEFAAAPELIHHLTTQMSPYELYAAGVPVCRTTHHPGQYVITFPQAYHAGFNAGFNCAEAVNFALPDWLPFGYSAIRSYMPVKREPIFAYERLALKVASEYGDVLPPAEHARLAAIVDSVVERETASRASVQAALGILFMIEPTDSLDVDYCAHCKAFLPLSFVVCGDDGVILCADHHHLYRHGVKRAIARWTLPQLVDVAARLHARALPAHK